MRAHDQRSESAIWVSHPSVLMGIVCHRKVIAREAGDISLSISKEYLGCSKADAARPRSICSLGTLTRSVVSYMPCVMDTVPLIWTSLFSMFVQRHWVLCGLNCYKSGSEGF